MKHGITLSKNMMKHELRHNSGSLLPRAPSPVPFGDLHLFLC